MIRPCIAAATLALLACAGAGDPRAITDAAADEPHPPAPPPASVAADASEPPPTPCTGQVPALPEPRIHVAIERTHACAWREAGPAYCWGKNETGELGDGTTTARPSPTLVVGVSDVLQISVGDWNEQSFSCALRRDRTVVCWGANEYGQLGDGTIWPYRTRPVAVLGLTDVAEIASSTNHTCARLLSGEVRCWGFLRDLALSDAAWDIAPRPVPVGELTDAQQIVTGMTHSCALKRDRTVACWGSNGYGEIGNGSPIAALRPTIVPGLVDVVKLSARSFAVCAQTADGRVRCWGNNEYGGLGIEPRSRDVRTPTLVPGLPCDAALMPAAFGVVTAYGRAYSWGAVGAPANTRATLAPASELVALVGAGPFFGIRADGRLVAWGGNPDGQLGDGTTEARAEPVTVTIPPGP